MAVTMHDAVAILLTIIFMIWLQTSTTDSYQYTLVKAHKPIFDYDEQIPGMTTPTECLIHCKRRPGCVVAAVTEPSYCTLYSQIPSSNDWVQNITTNTIVPRKVYTTSIGMKLHGDFIVLMQTVLPAFSTELCGLYCAANPACVSAHIRNDTGNYTCALLDKTPLDDGVSWMNNPHFITLAPWEAVVYYIARDCELQNTSLMSISFGLDTYSKCTAACESEPSCVAIQSYVDYTTCYLIYEDIMVPEVKWVQTSSATILLKNMPKAYEDSDRQWEFVFVANSFVNEIVIRKWRQPLILSIDDPATIQSIRTECLKVDPELGCREDIRINTPDWRVFKEVMIKLVPSLGPDVKLTFNSSSSDDEAWFTYDNLRKSPWIDLSPDVTEFTIHSASNENSSQPIQSFAILNSTTDNCSEASGWLVILESSNHSCYDIWTGGNTSFPVILYSQTNQSVVWSSKNQGFATMFAVYGKI